MTSLRHESVRGRSYDRAGDRAANHKFRVLTSVSVIALTAAVSAGPALAQTAQTAEAAPTQSAQAPGVEEIVVTGTRIVRDGYEAPTPVSVLGAAELSNMAVTNIADAVNRLPAFSRSTTTTNSASSDVTAGVSNLNLRGLQAIRTLVLLDGKRVVGGTLVGFSNNGSAVDINIMPDGLISRVDVVTGGASAVYGSDALAGVVNFVLDKKFTGIKGNIQGGITTRGDDEQYAVTLTAGVPFANDRGHFLFSAEDHYTAGIAHNNRPWSNDAYALIVNPAYGTGAGQALTNPQYTAVFNAGLATATRGGLITSGPLKGTMFLAGGAPATFNYGPVVSGNIMSGGDWQISRIDREQSMDFRLYRQNVFTRVSYDVADNINAFFELGWAYTKARVVAGVPFFHLGNVTVKADNAFIPATVKARLTALGLTQFTLGTTNADEPTYAALNGRTFRRYVAGFEGKADAFDTTWTWDASYSRSTTHVSTRTPNDEITANYNRASDAVVDPNTGQIVCRVITGDVYGRPCVPYNVMGIGVNSKAALDYIASTAYSWIALSQDVFQASASGEPFSTWAGPVSLALSAEHRYEAVDSDSTPIDQARGFFASNYTASHGRYSVNEGAIETVIPLAKDAVWAKTFDISAAVRFTSYSTSGYVTTWKVGGSWKPIDDITLRATQSRDIRAPNLGDLFSAGRSGTGTVIENGVTSVIVTRVGSNPNLLPEKADETGLGVVLQPSFFPGFGASVDYYNIKINGAIVSLSAQNYVDQCAAGNQSLCSLIQRDSTGRINFVAVVPANFQLQQAKGFDFEASYNINLEDISSGMAGSMTLRAMANYVKSLKTVGLGVTTEGAGVVADAAGIGTAGLFSPKWRYMLSASYKLDAFSGTVTARGIGAGVYNNAFISCTSGCPASTALAPTLGIPNHTPGRTFYDMNVAYKVFGDTSEVFLVVQNVFDTEPPLIAASTGAGYYAGQGNSEFDRIGRVFRAGVRFKY
jgi:iron complex outermembrane receptor protein